MIRLVLVRTGCVKGNNNEAYLVPDLIRGGGAGPVLGALNVQPDATRPLTRAVRLQIRHQLTRLRGGALGASGACD
jgi:hypothetical protein